MANMQESSPVFSRKGAKGAKFFMCFYLYEIAFFSLRPWRLCESK
jgi:hypothetical protein